MRYLALLMTCAMVSSACGGGGRPEPAAPGGAGGVDEPPSAAARSQADCDALLDHLETISFEALDRDGIGAACVDEWSDDRFACMTAAADADAMEACWSVP
jgi:hypothetical protein